MGWTEAFDNDPRISQRIGCNDGRNKARGSLDNSNFRSSHSMIVRA